MNIRLAFNEVEAMVLLSFAPLEYREFLDFQVQSSPSTLTKAESALLALAMKG